MLNWRDIIKNLPEEERKVVVWMVDVDEEEEGTPRCAEYAGDCFRLYQESAGGLGVFYRSKGFSNGCFYKITHWAYINQPRI